MEDQRNPADRQELQDQPSEHGLAGWEEEVAPSNVLVVTLDPRDIAGYVVVGRDGRAGMRFTADVDPQKVARQLAYALKAKTDQMDGGL